MRASLDIKRNLVRIDFCCNDPDNGLFANRAQEIQIGDQLIELEALRYRAPTLAVLEKAIRLAGKTWPIHGGEEWIGNWCWNGYWLELDDAVRFLVWLHGRGLYACGTAETRIFNLWQLPDGFADESARHLLWRLLGKPSSHGDAL